MSRRRAPQTATMMADPTNRAVQGVAHPVIIVNGRTGQPLSRILDLSTITSQRALEGLFPGQFPRLEPVQYHPHMAPDPRQSTAIGRQGLSLYERPYTIECPQEAYTGEQVRFPQGDEAHRSSRQTASRGKRTLDEEYEDILHGFRRTRLH